MHLSPHKIADKIDKSAIESECGRSGDYLNAEFEALLQNNGVNGSIETSVGCTTRHIHLIK